MHTSLKPETVSADGGYVLPIQSSSTMTSRPKLEMQQQSHQRKPLSNPPTCRRVTRNYVGKMYTSRTFPPQGLRDDPATPWTPTPTPRGPHKRRYAPHAWLAPPPPTPTYPSALCQLSRVVSVLQDVTPSQLLQRASQPALQIEGKGGYRPHSQWHHCGRELFQLYTAGKGDPIARICHAIHSILQRNAGQRSSSRPRQECRGNTSVTPVK